MDNKTPPLLGNLSRKMAWLSQRQAVLAENVANADTPKFKPSDLKAFQAAANGTTTSQKLQLATTEGATLTPSQSGGAFQAQIDNSSYEREPDGNGVVLEQQLMKVAKTQSDYSLMTNLYKKQISLLKMAVGHSGS